MTESMVPATGDRRVRYDIEGLRALAVLAVLINHGFPKALSGGFAGVDIFFVISGYLIGGHLLEDISAGRLSILGFYARRARRIFPALALVLICVWCFGWRFSSAPELAALGRHIVAAVLFSNNILLWSQSGYFDTAALDKPLLHLWSLGIEEQFYLLIPAILWLSAKGAMASVRWVARLGALSLLTTIVVSNFDYVASFYLLHTRFWELALGVVLAQAQLRMQAHAVLYTVAAPMAKRDVREVLFFCIVISFSGVLLLGASDARWEWETVLNDGGLALAIGGAGCVAFLASQCVRQGAWNALTHRWLQRRDSMDVAISGTGILLIAVSVIGLTSDHWPGAQTLLPVLGSALVIAARPTALFNRFLALKPLVSVGGISYPLYLWHWPAIFIFSVLRPDAGPAERLIPLVLSFGLAWLTKVLLEDPVRFGRLGVTTFRRPPLWPVVSSLMVAGILGLLVSATDNVPSRFPPRVQAVADWSEDNLKPWRISRCYLASNSADEFSSECIPSKRSGVPLVFLWGDSHAAHLYSGMVAIQSAMPVDIAQWTVAGCPPTVKPFRESAPCAAWGVRAMTTVSKLKPDTVVLAGAWERYMELGPYREQIMATLFETVRRLKELGIGQIVVFGPGPLWKTSLPVDVFRYMVRTQSNDIPVRLGTVSDANWDLDAAMAARAASEHVHYVSVLKYFCDRTGCLTVGDNTLSRPDLLYRDRDHLSVSGSKFLIAHARSQLFLEN